MGTVTLDSALLICKCSSISITQYGLCSEIGLQINTFEKPSACETMHNDFTLTNLLCTFVLLSFACSLWAKCDHNLVTRGRVDSSRVRRDYLALVFEMRHWYSIVKNLKVIWTWTNSNVICLFAVDILGSTCSDNSRTKTDITLLIHNILCYTCRHFYRGKGNVQFLRNTIVFNLRMYITSTVCLHLYHLLF